MQRVRVGVPHQQHHLKKQQAHRPHTSAAAEPWQDVLAHHRLHEKQQKRAEKNWRCKTNHDRSTIVVFAAVSDTSCDRADRSWRTYIVCKDAIKLSTFFERGVLFITMPGQI